MAQRTVHYAFGQLLADACALPDAPRFLFGTLLPDAIVSKAERDASHFVRISEGKRCYDFARFRHEFDTRIPSDPLYLGYYMHLVEDNFYRSHFRRVYDFDFSSREPLKALYQDYHLLNPWLRRRFALVDRLETPDGLAHEPLLTRARFVPDSILPDFAEDLREEPEGDFSFLSPAIIERFFAEYLPLAERELRAVLRGETFLRPDDFAWEKKHL